MHRYIGVTDEPLCEEGIRLVQGRTYPDVELVFVSPLKRCREMADLIYPNMEKNIIGDLSECDFGDFENKNAEEMQGNPDYQAWVDSFAALPFPNGESREDFIERSLKGFAKALEICKKRKITRAALVVHGGTIMSIMSGCAAPAEDYYFFQAANGDGYELEWDEEIEDAVDFAGRCGRIFDGFNHRGSTVAVPSGAAGGEADHPVRKNYKRLFPEN